MSRVSYEKIVVAFQAFVLGFKAPGIIYCATDAYQELWDLFFGKNGLSKYPPVWISVETNEYGRETVTGWAFECAAVVRDTRLPSGTIKFRNLEDESDPYLNGTWHLDEDPRVLYRQEMKRA